MPPLLAAFLLQELGCDLRIVQAIDLHQQWRLFDSPISKQHAICWYKGGLGEKFDNPILVGTFFWPANVSGPKSYSTKTKPKIK